MQVFGFADVVFEIVQLSGGLTLPGLDDTWFREAAGTEIVDVFPVAHPDHLDRAAGCHHDRTENRAIFRLFAGQHRQDNWRIRVRCERIIIREMLSLNLRERAERLRRWANAA